MYYLSFPPSFFLEEYNVWVGKNTSVSIYLKSIGKYLAVAQPSTFLFRPGLKFLYFELVSSGKSGYLN